MRKVNLRNLPNRALLSEPNCPCIPPGWWNWHCQSWSANSSTTCSSFQTPFRTPFYTTSSTARSLPYWIPLSMLLSRHHLTQLPSEFHFSPDAIRCEISLWQCRSAGLLLSPPSSWCPPAPRWQHRVLRSGTICGSVQHCSATTEPRLCHQHWFSPKAKTQHHTRQDENMNFIPVEARRERQVRGTYRSVDRVKAEVEGNYQYF